MCWTSEFSKIVALPRELWLPARGIENEFDQIILREYIISDQCQTFIKLNWASSKTIFSHPRSSAKWRVITRQASIHGTWIMQPCILAPHQFNIFKLFWALRLEKLTKPSKYYYVITYIDNIINSYLAALGRITNIKCPRKYYFTVFFFLMVSHRVIFGDGNMKIYKYEM